MFATMLFGDALTEDSVAFGVPATKVTWLLTLAAPNTAVTVFVSALVEASVVVYTPFASVFPFAAPNTLLLWLLLSATAWLGTRLPNASRTVTTTPVVAVPLATTPLGDSASEEVAVAGAPATNVMVVCGDAAPAVTVIVFASALFERSVKASWPFASVVPLVDENVSFPPVLLLATDALRLATALAYWSRMVAVKLAVVALSATCEVDPLTALSDVLGLPAVAFNVA